MELYMAVELSEAYALVGFIGTSVAFLVGLVFGAYRIAKWLRDQFASVFNARLDPIEKKLDDLTLTVQANEAVQNQHSQRLAHLEGKLGLPLSGMHKEET